MGQPPTGESARAQWPAYLTSLLFGAACGMGVNALSDDFGYPGAAAAFGLSAVVSAVLWLRRLPTHAPLSRYATRSLLALALLLAVAAAARPSSAPALVVAAAVVVVSAVGIVTDLVLAFRVVAGVACVAFGVGFAGAAPDIVPAADPHHWGVWLVRALIIVQGTLLGILGLWLSAVVRPTRTTLHGLGLICLIGGGAALASSAPSGSQGWQAALTILSLAFLSGGAALFIRRPLVRGAAAVLAGALLIACGIVGFTSREALAGAGVIAAGIGTVGAGVAAARPARRRWRAQWTRLTGGASPARADSDPVGGPQSPNP